MAAFKPARERNARRFRDWPGSEKALGRNSRSTISSSGRIDKSQYDRLFREHMAAPNLTRWSSSSRVRSAACSATCVRTASSSAFRTTWAICACRIRSCRPRNEVRWKSSSARRRTLQGDLFAPTEEELAEAEALRTTAEDLLFRTFYRALKAKVHKYENAVPIQVLRRSTIDRAEDTGQSQATRAWNFATALYYKAGGLPWRPADLPEGVCFIGVSFHHLKKRGGHLVYASVAQAFSSDHEPFCLKGAHIDHEQRRDRQPYLNKSQAFSMMRDILHGYEMRRV